MFDSPSGQDVCKPADVHGHLLILRPTDCRTVATTFGDSEGVELDIADLDDNDPTSGQPGRVYRGAMWFPKALVSGLRGKVGGQPVLATVVQGTAKPNQSAPWLLQSATDDAGAVSRATSWLNGHPEFLGGFTAPASQPAVSSQVATAAPVAAAAPAQAAPAGAPDLSSLTPEARAVVEQMLAGQKAS